MLVHSSTHAFDRGRSDRLRPCASPLLPVAWADYFGRESYGAIRGVALTLQVLAQAAGPLLSGALRDWSGTYTDSLLVFGVLSALAVVAALAARRPLS